MKICTKCKETKDLDGFPKDSRTKDGYHSSCKTCIKLRDLKYRQSNRLEISERRKMLRKLKGESFLKKIREYRENNKDRINALQNKLYKEKMENDLEYRKKRKETGRQYFLKNKDVINKWRQEFCKTPEGTRNFDKAKRKAQKLHATPKWLSKEHLKEIRNIYKEAKRLTNEKNIEHQVDHIIPLVNKNVCGLHVPWNLQILTRNENASKGNKL
jgi:hypothetical protein